MTRKTVDTLRIGSFYHAILDMAVRIDMTLNSEERDELVSLLLREAARNPEDATTLFLQSSINYIRSISDV